MHEEEPSGHSGCHQVVVRTSQAQTCSGLSSAHCVKRGNWPSAEPDFIWAAGRVSLAIEAAEQSASRGRSIAVDLPFVVHWAGMPLSGLERHGCNASDLRYAVECGYLVCQTCRRVLRIEVAGAIEPSAPFRQVGTCGIEARRAPPGRLGRPLGPALVAVGRPPQGLGGRAEHPGLPPAAGRSIEWGSSASGRSDPIANPRPNRKGPVLKLTGIHFRGCKCCGTYNRHNEKQRELWALCGRLLARTPGEY